MDKKLSPKERMAIQRQAMPEQNAAERARNFKEVNLGFDEQLALLEADRCIQCKNPKCAEGCPVRVNIPRFIGFVAEGDLAAAAQSLLGDNALPSVTGRVCPQETQCEAECIRGVKGKPVAIGYLERYVADWALQHRNGAKPVTQYRDEGYLPDAMVNYLARLGWSHGDDEIFSREQFLQWFNLDHLGRSAAQFDEAKLRWVNAQHLKAMADDALAALVAPQLQARGVSAEALADGRLPRICALFKDRCDTTVALANWAQVFYGDVSPVDAERAQHVTDAIAPALDALADALSACEWDKASISAAFKQVLAAQGLKMPQLAMPARVLTVGTAHTPSVDAVLELVGREKVVARLRNR